MSGDWRLNHCAIVFVTASPERVWSGLTDAELSRHAFMGQSVLAGGEGARFAVGQSVRGRVLISEPPHRLRVTWEVDAPPSLELPHCEVEFLIEPASDQITRLTVSEFVDGEVPGRFVAAGRAGWGYITSALKTWLETGRPLPGVKLQPPG